MRRLLFLSLLIGLPGQAAATQDIIPCVGPAWEAMSGGELSEQSSFTETVAFLEREGIRYEMKAVKVPGSTWRLNRYGAQEGTLKLPDETWHEVLVRDLAPNPAQAGECTLEVTEFRFDANDWMAYATCYIAAKKTACRPD